MSIPSLRLQDCVPEPPACAPTVLIVEDEESLRFLMRMALRSAGYATLESAAGNEAARHAVEYRGRIDLVVADSGAVRFSDLVPRLATARPGVPVLFISGLPRASLLADGWLDPSDSLLEKPFRMRDLVHRVTELLGDASDS